MNPPPHESFPVGKEQYSMVDEGCWYSSKLAIASGTRYVASLSSTQQMRKSIQVQFELILHPSSSYATASSMHPAGRWSLRKLGELLWLEPATLI